MLYVAALVQGIGNRMRGLDGRLGDIGHRRNPSAAGPAYTSLAEDHRVGSSANHPVWCGARSH
jgi:hypothetical protein